MYFRRKFQQFEAVQDEKGACLNSREQNDIVFSSRPFDNLTAVLFQSQLLSQAAPNARFRGARTPSRSPRQALTLARICECPGSCKV